VGSLRLNAVVMVLGATVFTGATAPTASGEAQRDPRDAHSPLDLIALHATQHDDRLAFALKATGKWRVRDLERSLTLGDRSAGRYLCLELRQSGDRRRYCLTRLGSGEPGLVGGRLGDAGEVRHVRNIRGARVGRPSSRSVRLNFGYERAGLRLGRFEWRALSGWSDPECTPGVDRQRCEDLAPDAGTFVGRLRRPRVVGCSRDEQLVATHGSSTGRRIALTFDDGPSEYTDGILDILDHYGAKATFFVVGSQVPGRTALLRRMIAEGHEIGNHSLRHEEVPPASSLAETSARVREATGFRPCRYRPPGGLRARGPIEAAWRLGMSSVLWDAGQPFDYELPGADAIYRRVVDSARPGSIKVMHDGGGDRSQTVAAMRRIVPALQHRGYRLVTVTELLGERFRTEP
jgi:peptidoglycan-N-acetylglucosamine deacetylase